MDSQEPLITEIQQIQWSKEIKDKRPMIYKALSRATQTPKKTGGGLMCTGIVSSFYTTCAQEL